jgi:NAD(P)-dependent dehydrogenase (short-subunit alcohol dehydrogenase family)
MNHSDKTALVTGANSGVGFEAAAQLAEAGWGKVILACRSVEKAEAAKAQLIERTAKDPFEVIAIDTSEVSSATRAGDELKARGAQIDFLLLNAGASSKDKKFNSAGVEITYASTLIGHHALTMRTLEHGLLAPKARIVIAGSEGARGNLPGMPMHDVQKIASEGFGGDRVATIEALMRLETPGQEKFVNMSEYSTAKLIVAWWAAALSRRLPAGMTVNAVSPGAALETNFARDVGFAMRVILIPMFKLLGPILGTQGPIDVAAKRYVDAADFDDDATGNFYATAHRKKFVGPVGIQTWPEHFTQVQSQEAGLEALVRLTGVGVPDLADATDVAAAQTTAEPQVSA